MLLLGRSRRRSLASRRQLASSSAGGNSAFNRERASKQASKQANTQASKKGLSMAAVHVSSYGRMCSLQKYPVRRWIASAQHSRCSTPSLATRSLFAASAAESSLCIS